MQTLGCDVGFHSFLRSDERITSLQIPKLTAKTRNFPNALYIRGMNRRQFNLAFTSLGAAPLLPTMAASATVTTPMSSAAAAHYPWAVRYARVQAECSPAHLSRAFQLAPELANELFDHLCHNDILSRPTLTGIAKAVNPTPWDTQFSFGNKTLEKTALSKQHLDWDAHFKSKLPDSVAAQTESTNHSSATSPRDSTTEKAVAKEAKELE